MKKEYIIRKIKCLILKFKNLKIKEESEYIPDIDEKKLDSRFSNLSLEDIKKMNSISKNQYDIYIKYYQMQLDNLVNDSVLKNYTVGLARIYVDNFGDYNSALYNDMVEIQKYIAELITSQP